MTAIVIQNGCGKSNVIDAVRWVMGDPARNIRGESMTDIIFNGSTSRKPYQGIDRAGLITLRGEPLASMPNLQKSPSKGSNSRGAIEIFLNGTTCRRRDVTDEFRQVSDHVRTRFEQG